MQSKYIKLLLILVAAFTVAVAIYYFTAKDSGNNQQSQFVSNVSYPQENISLNLWLPAEEKGNFEPIVSNFTKLHPTVTINISYLDNASYQAKLLETATTKTMPDMFTFRSDGLPLYKKHIVTAPANVYNASDYSSQYSPFAVGRLTNGNNIYAVPLGIATLGLIYNEQKLADASVNTDIKTWQQFADAAQKLTRKDGSNLLQSGVALGSPTLRKSTDILSVLMMQNGATMTDTPPTQATFNQPDSTGYNSAAKALAFYASFAQPTRQNYSWAESLGESTTALAEGKTAMIIEYSTALKVVRAQNSSGTFGSLALPQTNLSSPINYGNILSGAVSANSNYTDIAWDFWRFASNYENQKAFSALSLWPASRNDLIEQQQNDQELSVYIKQISSANDWYKGINYLTNANFSEMIANYIAGLDSVITVNNAASKVTKNIQLSNQ